MSDLRAALGVPPDPEFDLDLPPGWSRQSVDDATYDHLLNAMRDRLMQAHQPALFAELRGILQKSFESMRANGAFAFFSATDPGPSTLFAPASLIASIRRAENGGTLDDLARSLIRDHGAKPLLGDMRTLKFEKEKTVRMGGATVVNHWVTYLTPIPGAKRRRALELVAGFARSPETSPDDPDLVALRALFDGCVSSLRWHRPAAQ